jgi:7,8-dihydroneopterin aldolase/epimerase/oxygenase
MDFICLRELKLDTVIGTHAWERRVRQTVSLDLEIGLDAKPAAASDRLADTLDYSALTQRLGEFVAAAEFQLIEALAEACARIVVTEFSAAQVRLVLHKPGAVRNAADVALRIERSRADYA